MDSPPQPPPSSSVKPVETISLPLVVVNELMFGSSLDVRLQTRITSCDPWPKIVRRPVGLLLKKADPSENQWVVFVFDTHAEVWFARDWQLSTSRLLLVKKQSDQQVFDNTLMHLLKDGILKYWLSKGQKITSLHVDTALIMASSQDDSIFAARGLSWLLNQWKEIKNPHNLPPWWGRPPEPEPQGLAQFP